MKYVSVYSKKDRPVWYAAFPDAKSGKRVYRATEFKVDDPQGKRKAWNWARAQARDGVLVREEASAAGWSWVEPWIRLKYRNQVSTLTNTLNWWSWAFSYLEAHKIETPRALDRTAVMAYPEWRMMQVKRSGATVGFNTALQEIKLLGRVMDEAIERGLAERNPARRLGLKKDPPPEKPEITDAALKVIREALQEKEKHLPLRKRWMTIAFEIAMHTGVRHAETQVPFDRIDLEAGFMRFRDAKKKEFYTIPIHPALRPLLEALKRAGAKETCIVPRKLVSGKAWSKFFKGLRKRHALADLEGVVFHSTRVTVITRFARHGVPIQQAMAYVHHASELIHKIYQRLRPADVMACLSALNYPSGDSGWAQSRGAPRST